MKIFCSLIFALVLLNSNAQPIVYYRTGKIINENKEKNPTNDANHFLENIYDGKYFLWLQFNDFPSDNETQNIEATGVKFYGYLPNNTFIASFPTNYNFLSLKQFKNYNGVCKPLAAYKIDNSLLDLSSIKWAVNNEVITVDVSLTEYQDKNIFINSLKSKAIEFITLYNNSTDVITLKATLKDIRKIALHPLVQYIEPIGAPSIEEDLQVLTTHRVTSVQTTDNWVGGKKLDGSGVNIGVGDSYNLSTHIDIQNRILSNSSDPTNFSGTYHSDHVTGIIAGSGALDPLVKGQAPKSLIRVYNGFEPFFSFPNIYNLDSIRLVNHSLGQGCSFSNYNSNSVTQDNVLRRYPELMFIHSSGNSGADAVSKCPSIITSGGYTSITGGFKAGKNAITVGNLSKLDVIAASSSRGPISDGRIKPEIAAVGTQVKSLQPNNGYATFDGTSMATPGVTGCLALMYQAYKIKNNTLKSPEGALMKAILLNTADDLGNPGPDFIYGYGRINVRKAVKVIENNSFLNSTISTGITNSHTINIPANVYKAKIFLYWADTSATAGAARSLVNNLDLNVIKDATTFLPWVIDLTTGIDATSCAAPAVAGIDTLNNMEQVEINNPVAGSYTVNISGKAIPRGPQKYFVVYEYVMNNEIVVTYPIGGETFTPSETQRIKWEASPGAGNFSVAYSLNNGTTWTTISSLVPSTRNYLDWTIPGSATSNQALIRVSRGTTSDISDTNFVIVRTPTNILFTPICQEQVKISWNAVASASSYDVFRLGANDMELIGTTNTTNLNIVDVTNGIEQWYAVRAKLGAKSSNGRLSNAVAYTNNSAVICPLPVKLISFNANLKNNKVELDWTVANEVNMMNYFVEKSLSTSFENASVVGTIKPINTTNEFKYNLIDENIKANTTIYYRLKMVDADKTTYSKIQAVKTEASSNELFTISPIPAKNNIYINSNNFEGSKLNIKIYNEIGVEVSNVIQNNISYGSQITLNITNLSNGNYVVKIVDAVKNVNLFNKQITILK